MKYPAIYESEDGSNYLHASELVFSHLVGGKAYEWRVIDSTEEHSNDKNITREYLANTYGEVVSPEHAEFIVKLAEVNEIQAVNPWREGLLFCFYYNSDGDLILAFYPEKSAKSDGEKQITIPLPPESNVNTPEEDFEMKQIEKNNGDNLMFGGDNKCKEWPCVGDEVEAKHPSGQTLKGELLAKTKEYAIIQQLGHEQHLHLSAWKFSKPKTPEQELRELLSLLWKENNHDFDMFLDVVTCHVNKKPQ